MAGVLVLAMLLLACAGGTPPTARTFISPIVLSMRCGDDAALVIYGGEGSDAFVLYRQQILHFSRAAAASGARYTSVGGGHDEWWNKGDNALFTRQGKFVAECVPDTDTDGAYLVRGNEPFWNLELSRTTLRYRTMEGDVRDARLESVQIDRDALVLYSDSALQLSIQPTQCSDSMSGQRYSQNVRLIVNGERRPGCGGPLISPSEIPP